MLGSLQREDATTGRLEGVVAGGQVACSTWKYGIDRIANLGCVGLARNLSRRWPEDVDALSSPHTRAATEHMGRPLAVIRSPAPTPPTRQHSLGTRDE